MEEMDKKLQEFSLEDIMREFSDNPEGLDMLDGEFEKTPPAAPETPEQPPEPPVPIVPASTPAAQNMGDTQVLPHIPEDTRVLPKLPADTIRMEPVKAPVERNVTMEQTQRLGSVAQPQSRRPGKPEPFSGDWEPEYEQPMGDYVPPQPIVFQPRSRLRELKRKLIAGPEKRFYELSELGVGKLQVAMVLGIIVVLLSAGATVLYELNMVQPDRMKLMVFGQFFAMLVSALLGVYQLMEGLGDLFRLRISLNTLLVVTFGVCIADSVLCLQELRVPCCAAFSLQVVMSLWSAYHKRTAEMNQMDSLRKAVRLDRLSHVPDYYEGRPGIVRDEGQVEDFMDSYSKPTTPERVVSVYCVLAILAAAAAGVMGGILHGTGAGIQAAAVTLLAAAPASFFVAQSRPAALLSKRLHALGTVLCGWQGVRNLAKKAVFPLSHEDLFPQGTSKMNGVKFYGSRDPDQVVAYTAALICANGGGLVPLFEQLLESRNGRHYDAENLQSYGQGGVGGEVCGEPVLVGVLSFMKEMGVEIPEGTRVNQAVYAAVDGELCGVFAITYERDYGAAAGLRTLCSYGGLRNILITEDFMLTDSFIRGKFGVRKRRVRFPDQQTRRELREVEPLPEAPALALMTKEGLAPMAYAVTGARVLRTATVWGTTIHLLAGLLGMGMMLVLTYYGALHLLTPANMFLYELVWLVPGLLITEWARSV